MELTEKDRKIVLGLVEECKELKVDINNRITVIEEALGIKERDPFLSPIQPAKPSRKGPARPAKSENKFEDKDEEGSSIQITFREGVVDEMKQRLLMQSLYQMMKQLCEENNIERLFIKIDQTEI